MALSTRGNIGEFLGISIHLYSESWVTDNLRHISEAMQRCNIPLMVALAPHQGTNILVNNDRHLDGELERVQLLKPKLTPHPELPKMFLFIFDERVPASEAGLAIVGCFITQLNTFIQPELPPEEFISKGNINTIIYTIPDYIKYGRNLNNVTDFWTRRIIEIINVGTVQAELGEATSQLSRAMTKIGQDTAVIESLRQQINAAVEEQSKYHENIRQLNTQNDAVMHELQKKNLESETINKKRIELQSEIDQLLYTLQTTQEELKTELSNLDTIREENRNLLQDLKRRETEITRLTSEITKLTKRRGEMDTRIQDLSQQNNALLDQLGHLTHEKDRLQHEVDKFTHRLDALRDKHQKALERVQLQQAQLRNELDECREQLRNLSGELHGCRTQNEQLRGELQVCNDQLRAERANNNSPPPPRQPPRPPSPPPRPPSPPPSTFNRSSNPFGSPPPGFSNASSGFSSPPPGFRAPPPPSGFSSPPPPSAPKPKPKPTPPPPGFSSPPPRTQPNPRPIPTPTGPYPTYDYDNKTRTIMGNGPINPDYDPEDNTYDELYPKMLQYITDTASFSPAENTANIAQWGSNMSMCLRAIRQLQKIINTPKKHAVIKTVLTSVRQYIALCATGQPAIAKGVPNRVYSIGKPWFDKQIQIYNTCLDRYSSYPGNEQNTRDRIHYLGGNPHLYKTHRRYKKINKLRSRTRSNRK